MNAPPDSNGAESLAHRLDRPLCPLTDAERSTLDAVVEEYPALPVMGPGGA